MSVASLASGVVGGSSAPRGALKNGLRRPCTSETEAVCEPYNWLVHGQGKAYATMNAPHSWLVAKCRDHENAVFNNLGCLKRSEIGCNHIRERQSVVSLDSKIGEAPMLGECGQATLRGGGRL